MRENNVIFEKILMRFFYPLLLLTHKKPSIRFTDHDETYLLPSIYLNDMCISLYIAFLEFCLITDEKTANQRQRMEIINFPFFSDKVLHDRCRPEKERKFYSPNEFYIFSTHFWEKLTGKSSGNAVHHTHLNSKNNNTWKYIIDNFGEFYQKVRRWTRNVDIFEKSTLIIPMNENQHWFLCVVSNLNKVFELCKSGQIKSIFEGDSCGERRGRSNSRNSNSPLPTRSDATLKILFLDSMRNPQKYRKRYETMKKYIIEEAKDKHNITDEQAKYLQQACIQQMPKVPQQQDGASCGMFMLEFIERILMDREYHKSMEPEDGSLWFDPQLVNGDSGREKIKNVIGGLFCFIERSPD